MKKTLCVAWVLLFGAAFPHDCWGQPGIPIPVTVPIHFPVHMPFHFLNFGEGGLGSSTGIGYFLGGLAAVIAAVWGIGAWNNRTVAHLRILRTPPGEAPKEIRRAWVAMELPLRRHELKPCRLESVGVLSQQKPEGSLGYAVGGRSAVAALAARSPDAAAWWRANAAHVVARGYRLFFPAEACEVVG